MFTLKQISPFFLNDINEIPDRTVSYSLDNISSLLQH